MVETYGHDPEGLIRWIRPRLRQSLATVSSPPSRVAQALYGCSILAMLAPILGLVASEPRALEALQTFLRRWH